VVDVVAGVVVDSVAAAENGTLHFAKPTVVTKWTVVNDIRKDWAMHTRTVVVVVIEKGMLFLPPPSNSHWAVVVVVAVEAAEESRIPNLSVALQNPCSHSNEEEERAASVVVAVVAASGIPV
jgi:hypothetical protein